MPSYKWYVIYDCNIPASNDYWPRHKVISLCTVHLYTVRGRNIAVNVLENFHKRGLKSEAWGKPIYGGDYSGSTNSDSEIKPGSLHWCVENCVMYDGTGTTPECKTGIHWAAHTVFLVWMSSVWWFSTEKSVFSKRLNTYISVPLFNKRISCFSL